MSCAGASVAAVLPEGRFGVAGAAGVVGAGVGACVGSWVGAGVVGSGAVGSGVVGSGVVGSGVVGSGVGVGAGACVVGATVGAWETLPSGAVGTGCCSMTLGTGAGGGVSHVGAGELLVGVLEVVVADELATGGASFCWWLRKRTVPPLMARTAKTPAPVHIHGVAFDPRAVSSPGLSTDAALRFVSSLPGAALAAGSGPGPLADEPASSGACSMGFPLASAADVALIDSGEDAALAAIAPAAIPEAVAPRELVEPPLRARCWERRRASMASRRRCCSLRSRLVVGISASEKSSSLRLIIGSVAGDTVLEDSV